MAKSNATKLRLLYVMQYLEDYSCEDEPISCAEILKYLENDGIIAERKAIYDDIFQLSEFGLDIVKTKTPKAGWFLASRTFEDAEVYLLADAVRTADFITTKKTEQLVDKLYSVIGKKRKTLLKKNGIASLRKCANESVYYNIDLLSTAIAKRKQVTLDYVKRELNKRDIIENKRSFTINPYALIWNDDHYYLVGNNAKHNNFTHLRVDKIKNVKITDVPRRECSDFMGNDYIFDAAQYSQRSFNMFSGEESKITLRCTYDLLDKVIDRFTDKIYIRNSEDGCFSFDVNAFVSEGLLGWILQFGGKIEVIAPEGLRKQMKDAAVKMYETYK